MKKSDIAMIILIASVSILIAYFVASSIFKTSHGQTATVKTVQVINSDVTQPDPAIFNSNAINPAVQVDINSSSN